MGRTREQERNDIRSITEIEKELGTPFQFNSNQRVNQDVTHTSQIAMNTLPTLSEDLASRATPSAWPQSRTRDNWKGRSSSKCNCTYLYRSFTVRVVLKLLKVIRVCVFSFWTTHDVVARFKLTMSPGH